MLDHITVFPAVRKVKGNDDHSLIEKTFLVNNIKVVMFPISSLSSISNQYSYPSPMSTLSLTLILKIKVDQ